MHNRLLITQRETFFPPLTSVIAATCKLSGPVTSLSRREIKGNVNRKLAMSVTGHLHDQDVPFEGTSRLQWAGEDCGVGPIAANGRSRQECRLSRRTKMNASSARSPAIQVFSFFGNAHSIMRGLCTSPTPKIPSN
jgi:hypothetical protein